MPIKIGQRPDHGFDRPLGLLSDCHRRIEHFLDVLLAIHRQAAGGPLTASNRADLETSLTYFESAAPKHTADEEHSLFPRLRASRAPEALHALDTLARLEHDHGRAAEHHDAVDALVRRWLANERLDPAETRELGERLSALHAIYREHIGIEDRELFPTAARVLSADAIQEIGREMAARRTKR